MHEKRKRKKDQKRTSPRDASVPLLEQIEVVESVDVDGDLVHRLHDFGRAEADRPLLPRPRGGGGVVHAPGRRRDPPGRSARAALVDGAADEALHAAVHGRAARPDPRITPSIPGLASELRPLLPTLGAACESTEAGERDEGGGRRRRPDAVGGRGGGSGVGPTPRWFADREEEGMMGSYLMAAARVRHVGPGRRRGSWLVGPARRRSVA